MRKIGYARVSSSSQNLDRQIAALRAEQVDVIFREKASGKDVKNRPQLEKALDELGTGDVFVVAEWDRATRSMSDGIAIIDRVFKRSAGIKVLDRKYLNLTEDDPVSRGVLALPSALAEDERRRIHKRANEGRVEAKKAGKHLGRKPKLTDHQQEKARERLAAGETSRAIARDMGVHHSTISRLGGDGQQMLRAAS
jgi:DNA invertase Pin-like site-specific DNA recombinase